jgi:hypothetical protein
MKITRLSHVVISILAVFFVGFFFVAAPQLRASARSIHTSVASHIAHSTISTNCPAPGTTNAAVMPSITLGTHPNIVYIVNEGTQAKPAFGTLKRYDIVTAKKVEVIKLANTFMSDAQVSANGQWLLFVAQVAGQNKLQLVRMDGKFLQTLYCGAPGEVQWSTDQRLVLFSDTGHIDLLNVTNGVLQVELSFTKGVTIHPRTWLDTTHAYVTLQLPDGPPESLLLLDTSNGPNQNYLKLPVVFNAGVSTPFCWDFDSSFDGKSLFTSQCKAINNPTGPGASICCGPSVIANHSPTDGVSYSYVYVNQVQAFTAVRAVTSKTLLFTVGNTNKDTSKNGVWRVGIDGSSPLRLTPSGEFNQFTQFPWSHVSRDGTKYALQIINSVSINTTYTLEYGSLSGGSPIVFASITNVQLATVGWTTM